ncbi:MAG TPA: hypothetical protein VGM05_32520 [Planctomycetaceae bacterium]
MQQAAAGAAHVGAQGAAHVGAGAQQVGAGAQQLDLWQRDLQHLILGILQHLGLQHFGAQQEVRGAQHEGAAGAQQVGAGAAHVGAGAQQVGAGAQQLVLQHRDLQHPPQLKACASVAVAQQNSRAAVNVIHFIVGIS